MAFILDWFKKESKVNAEIDDEPKESYTLDEELNAEEKKGMNEKNPLAPLLLIQKANIPLKFSSEENDGNYDFSKIKKNSLWNLLADFSILTDTITPIEIDDFSPSKLTPIVSVAKAEIFTSLEKDESNKELDKVQEYQQEMYELYKLYIELEGGIEELISSKEDSSNLSSLLLEYSSFLLKVKQTYQLLNSIIEECSQAIVSIEKSKADVEESKKSTKYRRIGTSVLGITAGVVSPYVTAITVAASLISSKVFFANANQAFDIDGAREELLSKLFIVLTEKKEVFDIALDYFEQLRTHLENLHSVTQYEESIEKIREMIPLDVLDILLKVKSVKD